MRFVVVVDVVCRIFKEAEETVSQETACMATAYMRGSLAIQQCHIYYPVTHMHHWPKQGYFQGIAMGTIKSWYHEQYGGLAKRYAIWYSGTAMYTHNMLHDQLVDCTTYNYIALIIAHL